MIAELDMKAVGNGRVFQIRIMGCDQMINSTDLFRYSLSHWAAHTRLMQEGTSNGPLLAE